MIDATDQAGDTGICHAHVGEEFIGLFGRHVAELFLDAGGDDHCLGTGMFGGELADAGDLGMGIGVFNRSSQFVFGDVAGVNGLFRGKQEKLAHDCLIVVTEFDGQCRVALVEVRHDDVDQLDFFLRFLVTTLGFLFARLAALFQ